MDSAELMVVGVGEWRAWLRAHHSDSDGVWLVLARKGTSHPTTLSYDEALEEALCFGWIDGQLRRRDTSTFCRRFTPRKARSAWSQRNVALVDKLISEGRMQPSGVEEVRRAQADGRYDAAYAGQSTIEVPDDFATALDANPPARTMFDQLNGANRYSFLYRIASAKRADTRARRIDDYVEMLSRGETFHPQNQPPA